MTAYEKYAQRMREWSDIQDHLPRLYQEARGVTVELGVRDGVSTAALLAGVENKGKILISVDINVECADVFHGHPQWQFHVGDSADQKTFLNVVGANQFADWMDQKFIDVLFIDTDHTFKQCFAELELWGKSVKNGGVVLLHDVITFPMVGKAVEYWAEHNDKKVELLTGSNGLGVIYV